VAVNKNKNHHIYNKIMVGINPSYMMLSSYLDGQLILEKFAFDISQDGVQ
jgi:hypothetical protein